MLYNFCKIALLNGGSLQPLILPHEITNGQGLCNPSVIVKDNEIYVNIRGVEYSLYHCEREQKFQNQWGVLAYLHPENDMHLRTNNFLCKLDPNTLEIIQHSKVDTSNFDVKPLWEFVGLEDARLVNWDNSITLSGIRRDTTTNGESRTELSVIDNYIEVSRTRIEAPAPTYCEKNWMPILDLPYHYIKWTNPTEIVKANIENKTSESILTVSQNIDFNRDIRGGSQVINYKNHWIALTHEVELWKNESGNKDGQYYHRFIVWDKDWNIVKVSDDFKFTNARIEFSCGLALHEDSVLITFGFQDSSAFILKITLDFFDSFIGISSNEYLSSGKITYNKDTSTKFIDLLNDLDDAEKNFDIAKAYYELKQYSSALSFFLRSAEFSNDDDLTYEALILVGLCLFYQGNRDTSAKTSFNNAISVCPNRPEAYLHNSLVYERKNEWSDAHTMIKIAISNKKNAKKTICDIGYSHRLCLFQEALTTYHVGVHIKSRKLFYEFIYKHNEADNLVQTAKNNIAHIDSLFPKTVQYNRDKYSNFYLKFDGLDKIDFNYSHQYQDLFVLSILKGKKRGKYLEIGCADPFYGSNTALLEKNYGWSGVSIDIKPEEVAKFKGKRKNKVICADATSLDYKNLCRNTFGKSCVIDYLQVDCEPPTRTFEILQMMPFDEFTFAVITFEHDYYLDQTKSIRELSREFLKSKGYVLVVGNVSVNNEMPFEDWWVHPSCFNLKFIESIKDEINDVVEIEKYILKNRIEDYLHEFSWGSLEQNNIDSIVREILHEGVYKQFRDVVKGDVVLDIGANAGLFTYCALVNEPKKVYCIEPSKKLIKTLSKNVDFANDFLGINNCVEIIDVAIVNEESDFVAVFCGDSEYKTCSFLELIKAYKIKNIDFMKVDCEGGEYAIFNEKTLSFIKNNVGFMAIEIHLRKVYGVNDYRKEFIHFRDNFLIKFNSWEALSDGCYGTPENLKEKIFDDDFVKNYNREFMVYINNA